MSTPVFEPYTGDAGTGTGAMPTDVRGTDLAGSFGYGVMPFDVRGSGRTTGVGAGAGAMPLALFASDASNFGGGAMPFDAHGYELAVAPPSIGIGAGTMPFDCSGFSFGSSVGDGGGEMPLFGFGTDAESYGKGVMPFNVTGSDVAPSRFATLYQFPWVEANGFTGALLSLSDDFIALDTQHVDFTLALLDLFTASTRYSRVAEALQALADGVSLADVAQLVLQSDLLDSFIASDLPTFTAQITVMMSDSFDMDDAGSSLAEILAALHDGFYATLTINTGDDTYTAWVMTPQTKAMRSYSNWNFNSYATIGAQFLAAGPAGIYRMGGSTDAGAAIRAAIRTGKMNFGSMAMKGAPLVYIGATTTGDMLLRVQATTVRGEDLEQTYRMTPAVANAPREHRVPVGRGFRSVYWTFELCNDVDGAAFEVHEWHALPVTHPGKLT